MMEQKRKGDYSTRQGVTTRPILKSNVQSVQVLHSLLRCFDHFMKLVVHVKAGVYTWTEEKASYDNPFLKKAKQELQDKIKLLGIKWDIPDSAGKGGTTTNGNVARSLLLIPPARNCILTDEDISTEEQGILKDYGMRLAVILRVISCKKSVNVDAFKKYCISTHLFLMKSFPEKYSRKNKKTWISIPPTLHKVLSHGWELMERNDECGLGALDEAGLEANTKILRIIRTRLSRKTSQSANIRDTLRRLWLGSDPKIHKERLAVQPYCRLCKNDGHGTRYCPSKKTNSDNTEDDKLFYSFLK